MHQSKSRRRRSSVKKSTAHHPSSDNGKQTAGCCFRSHFLKYFCLQCIAKRCNEKHLAKNTSAFAQYKLFHNLFNVKFKSVFKYIVGNFNRNNLHFMISLNNIFDDSPSRLILQDWDLRSVQSPWNYETKICCQLGKCRSVTQLQISNFFTYKLKCKIGVLWLSN